MTLSRTFLEDLAQARITARGALLPANPSGQAALFERSLQTALATLHDLFAKACLVYNRHVVPAHRLALLPVAAGPLDAITVVIGRNQLHIQRREATLTITYTEVSALGTSTEDQACFVARMPALGGPLRWVDGQGHQFILDTLAQDALMELVRRSRIQAGSHHAHPVPSFG